MADDYTDFHPGSIIADQAERYKALIAQKKLRTTHAAAAARTPEQAARAAALKHQPCPAHPGFTHWIPPSERECVRGCGTRLDTSP